MRLYRKINSRIRARKRHFQLLEVMVAILILMLCAAPALDIFTRMYIAQERIVRINKRDHLARLVQAKVVERLYQNSIAIDDFNDKNGQTFPFSDPELDRLLAPLAYEASYRLALKDSHPKTKGAPRDKYLIALTIVMKDQIKQKNYPLTDAAYSYDLYINAGWKKNSPSNASSGEEEEDDEEGREGEKSLVGQSSGDKLSREAKKTINTKSKTTRRSKKQKEAPDGLF
jgi:hypothetical protein